MNSLGEKNIDPELNKASNSSNLSTLLEQHSNFEYLLESDYVRNTLISLYVIVITLSVLGNLALIIYIAKSATFTNGNRFTLILILNLAVCDVIRSATLSPIKLFEFFSSIITDDKNDDFCEITSFFFIFFTLVGFHTVVAISLERLILICYPFKVRLWLTTKLTCLILVIVCLCAFVFSFLLSFETLYSVKVELASGKELNICVMNSLERAPTMDLKINSTVIFVIYYFVPVIIITISYVKIFRVLTRKNRLTELYKVVKGPYQVFDTEKAVNGNNNAVQNAIKSRRCLAKIMLAIAICFAFFNGPTFFIYLGIGWGLKIQNNSMFCILVIKFLPNISSVLSPLIYCARYRILRRNFVESYRGKQSRTVFMSTPVKVFEIKTTAESDDEQHKMSIHFTS